VHALLDETFPQDLAASFLHMLTHFVRSRLQPSGLGLQPLA